MIVEVRAQNCFIFSDEVAFSMSADLRNKKFISNVYQNDNYNILKVAGVYGANNTGKTCLIKCVREIKNVMLNTNNRLIPNWFSGSSICSLGITFLYNQKCYSFDFKFNVSTKEFVYEKFSSLDKDKYGNKTENVWFERDYAKERYVSVDAELSSTMKLVSRNNLLCYLINTDTDSKISEAKDIITNFAEKIDIVNMNDIPVEKTIEVMKNKNDIQMKVVSFVKNADLYMDDFVYEDAQFLKNAKNESENKVLNIPEKLADEIKLTTVYRGIHVPSILYDSTGTQKIIALASYIVEAIEQGKILVVDELDSSIHFKLTRAIVSMFNNELNTDAQLIFSVHDINLMDCKRLFRKEQIWFVHKDKQGVYLYSLADFTAQDGVRGDTTDIVEKYRKGVLGALPDPELINTLIDIKGKESEVINSEKQTSYN